MSSIQEWIKIVISFAVLVVMIIGLWLGLSQIQQININLDELKSSKISTQKIAIIENGSEVFKIYYNGSCAILQNPNGSEIHMC